MKKSSHQASFFDVETPKCSSREKLLISEKRIWIITFGIKYEIDYISASQKFLSWIDCKTLRYADLAVAITVVAITDNPVRVRSSFDCFGSGSSTVDYQFYTTYTASFFTTRRIFGLCQSMYDGYYTKTSTLELHTCV